MTHQILYPHPAKSSQEVLRATCFRMNSLDVTQSATLPGITLFFVKAKFKCRIASQIEMSHFFFLEGLRRTQ